MRGESIVLLTRVKQDETIGTNEVDTASTSFAAEQKYKLFSIRIIKLIDEFLSLGDGHSSIKPEETVPYRAVSLNNKEGCSTYFLLLQSFSNKSKVWV